MAVESRAWIQTGNIRYENDQVDVWYVSERQGSQWRTWSLVWGGTNEWCMQRNRLRWLGHVERKGDDDWVKRCTKFEVMGKRPRSKPKENVDDNVKRWNEKRCFVTGECDKQRLVEEDPWCKTADPG
jgi:hypothetical protein